jgi:hypothetical protein
VRNELSGHRNVPHAAVKKDDYRGARGARVVSRRKEKVRGKILGRRVKIDERMGILEQFAVAGFADGRGFNKFFYHVGSRNDR